jgi:hypothetical protein
MARWRSLRCSPGAAVFVESDETTRIGNHSALVSFRRLLLQIGGANIAGRGSRFEAAELVVVRGRKRVPSLVGISFVLAIAGTDRSRAGTF